MLYDTTFTTIPSLLTAILAAFIVLQFVPTQNPINIVNVPLITNYSKQNKHFALYTFFNITLITTLTINHNIQRIPTGIPL